MIETAVIASVGTAGATTLDADTHAGAAAIPVASAIGFIPGQTVTIDGGANAETSVIAAIGRTGGGVTLTLISPLTLAHSSGAQVSGSGITLTSALSRIHDVGASVSNSVPTPGAPNKFFSTSH